MLKLFGLLFYISFFLFQGTLSADENIEMTETEEHIPMEEMEQKEIIIPEEAVSEDTDIPNELQDTENQTAEQDDASEAQREADAAEEAELREVGVGEEPVGE